MNATPDDRVAAAFAEVLGLPLDAITDDLRYRGIPQWDSIAHMSIVAALEAAFGIMIDMDDVIDMSTVGKAREIVARHGH